MKHPLRNRAAVITPFALGVSVLALLLVPANAETPTAQPQKIPTVEVSDASQTGVVELPESKMIVTAPKPEPKIEVEAPKPEPVEKEETAPEPKPETEVEASKPKQAEKEETETKTKTKTEQERGKTPFTEGDMTKAEEKESPAAKTDSSPDRSQATTRSASAPRTSPGSNQDKARVQVEARGWGAEQFTCLSNLWMKESSWNHLAENPSSGAYGIPQALPASKMASHGSDYRTNPDTQIAWGLDYISDRYGTPCSAWAHSQQKNWY